ncbi:MAG TPA: glycosyltransferase family 39 protein [Vicinamibacteria bacterium]
MKAVHGWLLAAALLVGAAPRIDAVSRLYPPDRDQRTDVRRYYDSMAESARSGRGWLPSYPTNFIPPPGQAFFIYAARSILPGSDYQHLRVVQALVSIVTIVAAFLLGWGVADPTVGILSAWLVALNYRLSLLVGTLVPDTNYVFLVFAALTALVWALRRGQRGLFVLSGLLLGIASLFRPVPTLLGPILALTVGLHPRGRWTNGLGFFLAFAAAIAPWIVRNRIHYGHVYPLSTNGGTLLALANAEQLDASRPDMVYWDDLYQRDYYRDPSIEARFAGTLDIDGKPEENLKDRAYARRALAYITRHPVHFLRNYFFKLANFVVYPPADPPSAPLPFRESKALLLMVTVAGLAGVLLLFRQPGAPAVVLAIAILYLLAFGALYHLTRDGRMNLLFRALLAVPAACALVSAFRAAAGRFSTARASA